MIKKALVSLNIARCVTVGLCEARGRAQHQVVTAGRTAFLKHAEATNQLSRPSDH